MPASSSELSLSERRERAFELYLRGYTVADVARDLQVSPNTAGRYKREYEAELEEQTQSNPALLQDVLKNTFRSLEELDQVRKEAWQHYERAHSDVNRTKYMRIIINCQDQRAKLFGLMGVKQQYMVFVNNVHTVQQKIMQFMREELCDRDREKLEAYLTEELSEFMDSGPVLDAEVVSAQ